MCDSLSEKSMNNFGWKGRKKRHAVLARFEVQKDWEKQSIYVQTSRQAEGGVFWARSEAGKQI